MDVAVVCHPYRHLLHARRLVFANEGSSFFIVNQILHESSLALKDTRIFNLKKRPALASMARLEGRRPGHGGLAGLGHHRGQGHQIGVFISCGCFSLSLSLYSE